MSQGSTHEFERLPLRGHDLLAGVPLHDVWVVDLQWTRPGITLNEFLRATNNHPFKPSALVRMLLRIRFFVGGLFGWDRESPASARETFATRLTDSDRSKSLVAPGTRDGLFRVVYRFENEQLLELANRTVHAAALSALVEKPNVYRFYFAIYVRSVGALHATVHGSGRPLSKTYGLSIPAEECTCPLESSFWPGLIFRHHLLQQLRSR
jgi:hypothetical protein